MDERTSGLPPAAAERVRRQAASHVAGSLLSAPALAALSGVGLEPVGEVMGAIVMHFGWSGSGCGGYNTNNGRYNASTPILTSGNYGRQNWRGYSNYVQARDRAHNRALARMLIEAAALGADGVVGVELRWSNVDTARELIALGTAVRHRRPERRRTGGWPFATELSGEDVAKAAASGWTPLGIAVGVSIAVKHHDWQMDQQTSWLRGAGNTEVDGLTGLLQAARAEARHKLTGQARTFPGAAHVVISRKDLWISERACSNNDQVDHLAEAYFLGTVLAHDPAARPPEPPSTLTMLPLNTAGRNGTPRNTAARNRTGGRL
jgi:uncharacterized protein YbjQ (UPF0145 family)